MRPGERSTLFRFWMASDTYQAVSAMQSLIFGNVAQHYLTTPGLAFTFFPTADPDFWAPAFAYFDLIRLQQADFEVGGRRYGVYAHDWRVMPPMAWLDLLAEFQAAIRNALRNLHRPDALRDYPLLHSQLVVERAGSDADETRRVTALKDFLKEAAESLQASPREESFYRALYRTYLHPAPTQERAAELLDLPFSTYRRHLKAGIGRVVETMWQKEIGGS